MKQISLVFNQMWSRAASGCIFFFSAFVSFPSFSHQELTHESFCNACVQVHMLKKSLAASLELKLLKPSKPNFTVIIPTAAHVQFY